MRIRFIAAALAVLAAPPAAAQEKVTAAHVFLACRYQSPTPVPSEGELAIQNFCKGMRIPLPGAEFTAHELHWWTGADSRIPAPDTIVRYARLAAEQTDQAHGWLQGDPITKNQILFAPNRWELTDQHRKVLDEAIQRMRKRLEDAGTGPGSGLRFRVVGYSDSTGGASASNLAVARNRAREIWSYLVRQSPGLRDHLDTVAVPRLHPALNTESKAGFSRAAAVLETPLAEGTSDRPAPASRSTPAFSGAGMPSLLVGVTDVLVERANEQLQVHVMKQVTATLCTNYETLIRQTCTLFPRGASAGYPPTVRMLRSALRDDLRGLPGSLATDMLHTAIPADADPARRDQAMLALLLLDVVGSQQLRADPLQTLAAFPTWKESLPSSLKIDASTPAMVHLAEFAEFVAATRAASGQLQSYRQLILEQDSGQAIPADTVYTYALRALVVNQPEALGAARSGFTTIERLLYARRQADVYLQSVAEVRDRLRDAPAGTAEQRATRAALYAELLTGLVNATLVPFQYGAADVVRTRAASIAMPVRTLAMGVGTENYSMALHGLVGVVNALTDDRATITAWEACMRPASAQLPGTEQGTPGGGERVRSCGPRPLDGLILLPASQRRILSFAVDVSEAEDADAVRASFRNFIGQSNGYRRKREGRGRYVFANAYVGGTAGAEWLDQRQNDAAELYGGMHVPVGVEMGWPVGRGLSLGPFVQVLDLGAIATRRADADDDGKDLENEAKLSKVFSPGVYLVLGGVISAPVSVGVGMSFAPDARFLDSRGLDARRISAFVGLDIPLFP